jgi:hypothetical protein
MKFRTAVHRSIAVALLSGLALPVAVLLAPAAHAYSNEARYFERQEIEQLTAPIALHPDPLLAQILAAAAYPEEIAAAQRYAQSRGSYDDVDRQDWDSSVRAIARYPEVLEFLARDLQWTEALGIANINQPDDVADAIQRWRLQAYDLGSLRTDSQQIVYVDSGYVRIVPAQQEHFYVPQYDPNVIYVNRYVAGTAPFLLFGPRYVYGAWFDKDWDWRRKRIYYCDRDYWRNGKPVFQPRFDNVRVDRNRRWQPDRVRFKPPEKPAAPARLTTTPVPSPPEQIKPGVRREDHPPTAAPNIIRGPSQTPPTGTTQTAPQTTPGTPPSASMHKRIAEEERQKQQRKQQQQQPANAEPPKPQVQQPQPATQQPQRRQPTREEEQQRGLRR